MGSLSICARMGCDCSVLTVLVLRVPFFCFSIHATGLFQDSDFGDTCCRRKVRTGWDVIKCDRW